MLRFNITRAMKLPQAREYAIPAPFPGKYPTRVGMVVQWEREGKKGFWRYVGKPNGVAAQRFERELARGGILTLGVMEWDRAWMISNRMSSWERPMMEMEQPALNVISPWLWTVYHPWHDQRLSATRWMREKFWIHRVGCALGENARLYSPMETMGGIYLADYRRRVNVVGQPPKEKKSTTNTDWERYRQDLAMAYAPLAPTAAPVEPAPEPLRRRTARIQMDAQLEAAQQGVDVVENLHLVGWGQAQTTPPQQDVPGRPRPRRRNLRDILDPFLGE